MTDPIFIRADAPELQRWSDERLGRAQYRLLVDASGGPSRAIVQGLLYMERGDREALHRHPDHPETVHVIEGEGVAQFPGRSVPLHPGDTLFVPAGTPHGWAAPDTDMTLIFTFPADRLANVAFRFEGEPA